MKRWTREEALKWADNFGPVEGEAPSGDAMALEALARELRAALAAAGLARTALSTLIATGDRLVFARALSELDSVLPPNDQETPNAH